jgi:hypothetical protein
MQDDVTNQIATTNITVFYESAQASAQPLQERGHLHRSIGTEFYFSFR